MNVLFYIPPSPWILEKMKGLIRLPVLLDGITVCRTIDDLSCKLHDFEHRPSIAVLVASSQKELSDLVLIRRLLSDIRIILVLPDMENESIRKGHTLFPRFLSDMDSDFKDIAAVLEKMLTWKNE